jgi:hypothetical protein
VPGRRRGPRGTAAWPLRAWAVGGLAAALALLAAAPAARAEDVEALRREVDAMRRQFDTVRRQYEQRMLELGERLRALENQPPAVAPPPPSVAPAPAVPGPATAPAAPGRAAAPSLTDLLRPRQPFALGSPGGLLFDMGLSGDFVADFTSAATERRHDGTFEGRENRLFPREVSLGIFGRVDPYASAVVRITAGEEAPDDGRHESEVRVTLEEASVTLFTLPLDTTARLGMMRPRFGTLNVVHQDDLPQVDRPDVLRRFFGEEQLNGEKGIEATWLLPAPFYEELALGVFNGDNEEAFGHGSLRDPLVTGRLRSFFELDELGAVQVDVSVASGKTDDDRRNTIAGLGVKYKWAPLTGYGFPIVTLAGELLYGNRRVPRADEAEGDRGLERWGAYLYAQYDWSRRWAAGLRYDWTELPTGPGQEWALSPYLQFKPSEFLRFRVQYKHTRGTAALERDADEVFLQGSFILGAHPTERF